MRRNDDDDDDDEDDDDDDDDEFVWSEKINLEKRLKCIKLEPLL